MILQVFCATPVTCMEKGASCDTNACVLSVAFYLLTVILFSAGDVDSVNLPYSRNTFFIFFIGFYIFIKLLFLYTCCLLFYFWMGSALHTCLLLNGSLKLCSHVYICTADFKYRFQKITLGTAKYYIHWTRTRGAQTHTTLKVLLKYRNWCWLKTIFFSLLFDSQPKISVGT